MTWFRPTSKQLVCPRCGSVLATATHRQLPAKLDVESVDGYPVMPRRASAVSRLAEQQGAPAERLAFLERNIQELVYELPCRCGETTLRTSPEIVRAVREAPGRWVTPL